jgi:hypothetical protein
MATSVSPAIDLAKKNHLSVNDLNSVKWLNVDETTYDRPAACSNPRQAWTSA